MSIFANKKDLELAQEQINSLSNDLSAAQAELTAERDTVATQAQSISDLQAQIATLTAERDSSAEGLTQAQAQIETLQAEVQTTQASASAKAAEILASAGVPPLENVDNAGSQLSIREQYNALKTPAERQSFREKNWNQLINQ